ncbi:MAG: hypothetical protein OXI07_12080 [Gammaproteobacteria bacterium]|nr:hypothetical protein [Gammaproteobacteria bacterium]
MRIGAGGKQGGGHALIAVVACRSMQGRVAEIVMGVRIGARFYQQCDDSRVPAVGRREVQRRRSFHVPHIDDGPRFKAFGCLLKRGLREEFPGVPSLTRLAGGIRPHRRQDQQDAGNDRTGYRRDEVQSLGRESHGIPIVVITRFGRAFAEGEIGLG